MNEKFIHAFISFSIIYLFYLWATIITSFDYLPSMDLHDDKTIPSFQHYII